jgi:hypothetical protein
MGEADALYEKWLKWLKTIENETMTLWLYRDYWRGLVEITQANPDLPRSSFFDALGVWYAAAQTTAVRRQLDRDKRAVSFWRLLTEIAKHPEVMTRERHVALWRDETDDEREKEHTERRANENYDELAAEGTDTIAPERTLEDRERLEAIAEPIVAHVNKMVAHSEEKRPTEVPTYADLNAAVDELGELLKKYVSLLEATWLPQVSPTVQDNWKAPFRVPWIKADT